ncbi:MAG: glycosyltransferase [Actinobacteria bacterium]|nr:glycosyltransferase [Actinomycetota bacterium]
MSSGPADPIRVLHLVKGLEAGGLEELLVQAARHRDRTAFAYEVAHLLGSHVARVPDLEAEGVPVTCLHGDRPVDPRWLGRLRRLVLDRPIHVVHAHAPLVASGARAVLATVPARQRPKLVVTLHNQWESHHVAVRALDRATWRRDDARLTVSEAVRRSLPEPAAARATTLVHGIDVAELRSRADRTGVRAELGVADHEVLVATVANLRGTKGYPDLIEAAAEVVRHHPEARFASVGQGPMLAELEAARHQAGLGDRFRFLGYRPDAARIVSGADVFCLSSHHEGLPVALMEALALGVPVVATDVGGIAELVHDGEQGLVVPPHRPDRLAEALGAVVADPAQRARLAEGARARGEELDAGAATAAVEALYRRLVGR